MDPNTHPVITEDNDLYAKLTVPTQSDGQTKEEIEIGSYTSGSIRENEFVRYVTRLFATDSNVEIGILIDGHQWKQKGGAKRGEQPERTIRLSYNEIVDVRKTEFDYHFPGLAIETSSDVYWLKFALKSGLFSGPPYVARSTHRFDESVIDATVDIIQNRIGDFSEESSEVDSPDNSPTSIVDELERLNDLHEQGAISQEEFEEAKANLLDE